MLCTQNIKSNSSTPPLPFPYCLFSLSVDTFKSKINKVLAALHSSTSFEPFRDDEVREGLRYLEDEENKVFVSDGHVYII